MPDSQTTVGQLRSVVRTFVDQRDWQQFHSPKNLSMALAIEAAELMEHFQWIDAQESRSIAQDSSKLASVGEELADIFIYLCSIANRLDIPLERAYREKEERNKSRRWD